MLPINPMFKRQVSENTCSPPRTRTSVAVPLAVARRGTPPVVRGGRVDTGTGGPGWSIGRKRNEVVTRATTWVCLTDSTPRKQAARGHRLGRINTKRVQKGQVRRQRLVISGVGGEPPRHGCGVSFWGMTCSGARQRRCLHNTHRACSVSLNCLFVHPQPETFPSI